MRRNAKKSKRGLSRKPKLDNARRLRGIYFIDPDYEEFKDIMKNARRKLEVPMPAAVPCKIQRKKYRETCGVEEHKTKYAGIVEADESMRRRMEGSPHKNHEDHIVGQGMNSLSHCNLVRKFIPMPQAMKSTRCEGSSGGMAADETTNKNEFTAEARNEGRKVHFASPMDLCHLKKSELETKGRVVLPGDIVKDDSGSYAVFTEQGSSASQMTAAKVMDIVSRLPGCAGQAADALSAYTRSKWKMHPNY